MGERCGRAVWRAVWAISVSEHVLGCGHVDEDAQVHGGRAERAWREEPQREGGVDGVLGGGVNGDINAGRLDAALMEGRRKRGVAHDPRLLDAVRLGKVDGNLTHRIQVGQPAGGVGGRLRVDHLS